MANRPGFLHLQRTGPIVMQLGRYFCAAAAAWPGHCHGCNCTQAEALCRQTPGIEAVTLQVVPATKPHCGFITSWGTTRFRL